MKELVFKNWRVPGHPPQSTHRESRRGRGIKEKKEKLYIEPTMKIKLFAVCVKVSFRFECKKKNKNKKRIWLDGN